MSTCDVSIATASTWTALIERRGPDLPIPVLGERLVCSKCGKRGVYIVANNADTGIRR